MPRKTADITIEAEGRDRGKVFRLREMPATQAEKWAARAFLAIAKSDVDLPVSEEEVRQLGMAGIAALGFKALAGVTFAEAEPLMDEMFACIQIIPDPQKPAVVRALVEDDIEEIDTRLTLRKEVFQLHVNFSLPAAPSNSSSETTGKDTPTT
jgi:hypothetical protein